MRDCNVLRGVYVDCMRQHWEEDTWELCRAGTRDVLVIGTKEQIMQEYDQTEQSGVIKSYK
jgi:hypothetical protein